MTDDKKRALREVTKAANVARAQGWTTDQIKAACDPDDSTPHAGIKALNTEEPPKDDPLRGFGKKGRVL